MAYPQPQPMHAAPRDGTEILVFARWDWDAMREGDLVAEEPLNWRVAQWAERYLGVLGFWSVADNPYTDLAVDARGWLPLPPKPEDL